MSAVLLVACSSPSQPTITTIIPPPAIACPAAPSAVTAANGVSTAVMYGSPTVTAGTPPVSSACAPASGTSFPVGQTTVTCTATDKVQRTSSCSFRVTVVAPPRLNAKTILAFGDSITHGEVPQPGTFGFHTRLIELDRAYPADLANLIAARYTAQSVSLVNAVCLDDPTAGASEIVVVNAGCHGEAAEGSATLSRLLDKLTVYQPDVLLLLEGVNDLDDASAIAPTISSLQAMIAAARSRGVRVFVGTLLPEIPGAPLAGAAPLIVPFNTELIPAAAASGGQLVDAYSDLVTDLTDWISPYDGLHPTEAGYQELAGVWFRALQATFESQRAARRR